MCGSQTATCARTSSSTSDGENCLARKPAIRSTAERSCSDVTSSRETRVYIGTGRHPGFDDAREHAGADWQDLVVQYVARIVHWHRAVMADPEIGAGDGLQHVGEILAAHLRLRPRDHLGWLDHGARGF